MPHIETSHARANLMTLPSELRNAIYEHLLVAEEGEPGPNGTKLIQIGELKQDVLDRIDEDENLEDSFRYKATTAWIEQPSLTRVSKQLRAETLPIYFGVNTFIINLDYFETRARGIEIYYSFKNGEKWLRQMGPHNRKLLKDLHIRWFEGRGSRSGGLRSHRYECVLSALGLAVPKGIVTAFVRQKVSSPPSFGDWTSSSQLTMGGANAAFGEKHLVRSILKGPLPFREAYAFDEEIDECGEEEEGQMEGADQGEGEGERE